jgi:DNA-binding beta-propeller fold protein YncE
MKSAPLLSSAAATVAFPFSLLLSLNPPLLLLFPAQAQAQGGSGDVSDFVGPPAWIDGVGTYAKFTSPEGISISPNGQFALVADAWNNMIRSVDLSTTAVTTVAGSIASTGSTNGIGTNADFDRPKSVSISPDGLFALIADVSNNVIRKMILSTSAVSTLAGSVKGTADGVGTSATFSSLRNIKISPNGLFALVAESTLLRRIEICGTDIWPRHLS